MEGLRKIGGIPGCRARVDGLLRVIIGDMDRHVFRLACHLLLSVVLTAGFVVLPAHGADTKDKEAATQKKLAEVKQRIEKLAREQRRASGQRDSIQAKLARQSDKLSAAAGAMRESEKALADNQHELEALEKKRDSLDDHLKSQRGALADLLRAAYKIRPDSDLRLLLGDADMARLARALAYSRYFQHDRLRRIHDLLDQLDQLQQVRKDIENQHRKLAAAHASRKQHMQQLDAARTEQQKLLAGVKARLGDQNRQMQQLESNRKSLSGLLEKLRDVLSDIPDQLPSDTPFAKLRGKLPWPVKGKSSRSNEGLHITVARGTRIHAVAHGRVIYADWLRGYGLLVIIDHGQGWMSLYGDNESVLHHTGDWVDAGAAIATSGASAGDDAGVYFGLRHHGKSVNPLPWLHSR